MMNDMQMSEVRYERDVRADPEKEGNVEGRVQPIWGGSKRRTIGRSRNQEIGAGEKASR